MCMSDQHMTSFCVSAKASLFLLHFYKAQMYCSIKTVLQQFRHLLWLCNSAVTHGLVYKLAFISLSYILDEPCKIKSNNCLRSETLFRPQLWKQRGLPKPTCIMSFGTKSSRSWVDLHHKLFDYFQWFATWFTLWLWSFTVFPKLNLLSSWWTIFIPRLRVRQVLV